MQTHTHILTDTVICPTSRACLSVNQEALVLAAARHNGGSKKHKSIVTQQATLSYHKHRALIL